MSPPVRIRYQTIEVGALDVHLCTLRDRQQFRDDDQVAAALGISSASWPLFGVLWDAGVVLAHLMLLHPIADRRILEVGCGIGLSSLVLQQRMADITATDHHPEANTFLQRNVALNAGGILPFFHEGWEDVVSSLGTFDLIVGSDLLYERGHAEVLSAFIDRHARPTCEVIVVDPGRGHHARFSKCMVLLGYHHQQRPILAAESTSGTVQGTILTYTRTR